ncbi:lipocalin-like [Ascaphus truei]|uniref:lipocalin-like n=1 Tax=Ascaphus truei TaxID=8439 RepID=UPI003F5A5543
MLMEKGSKSITAKASERNELTEVKALLQGNHFLVYSSPKGSCEVYELHVVETNYKEYAMMSMRMTKGTDVYTIATLLGRSKKLRTEQLFNFRNFCLQQGLMGAQYSHSSSNCSFWSTVRHGNVVSNDAAGSHHAVI